MSKEQVGRARSSTSAEGGGTTEGAEGREAASAEVGAEEGTMAGGEAREPDNSSRRLVFELEIPIRWGDMDAMGHVNNAVYFRYMEQARISWFDHLGLKTNPAGQGPVIVNASCTFARQLTYPGTVLVRQYVGEFGRSSVMTHIDMLRTDVPDVVHAHGSAKVVWVDFPRQKSQPLPDTVRKLMQRSWPSG